MHLLFNVGDYLESKNKTNFFNPLISHKLGIEGILNVMNNFNIDLISNNMLNPKKF